ncbi:MAG: rRNA maturation RNase YbeY [Candidatus Eisenbacteria bacterium]
MAVSILVRGRARVDRRAVRRLADAVLRDHAQEASDVSIVFTTDGVIRGLNREYRNADRPTDVLAFSGDPSAGAADAETVLGDVVISVDRAAVQARRFRRSFDREILKLTAHGLLHLLGRDHERPGERTVMRRLENRYVRAISDHGGSGS